jgi:FtsP/CotA-like multicopper oxidase with cupredoxin domain
MRAVPSLLLVAAFAPWITHAARSHGIARVSRVPSAARVLDDPKALPNDNRAPAGRRAGDTLVLRLTLSPAAWHILGDSNRAFRVLAFAEEGKAPTIPAPLIRVRVGTPVHVVIRNPLADTLVVRGLGERSGVLDSLVIGPSSTEEVRFIARREGTYHYWGATAEAQRLVPARARSPVALVRPRFDSQLAGALVVDPQGPVSDDRVFVITEFSGNPPATRPLGPALDRHGIPAREFTAFNGRSWPYTERLRYTLGDTVRWRIINTTFQAHPMHLHGFYFRVDSHGSAGTGADSIYPLEQRRMAVTEVIGIGQTASIVWSPDRPGGWIFHCHLTNHAAKLPPVDQDDAVDYPITHAHGDPDHHVVNGMNGLVLGVTVTGRTTAPTTWRPIRRLRLFVQSDSAPGDTIRRFGYVLQRGAEPRRDSVENPGPVLVLTRGEPTSIEVVNRSTEATAVHWHGIELESYFDGAVGWSGTPGHVAPAIRPESTFEVHITPRRAGTFMYHTHVDEMRQQFGGLVGALVVVEPGERWDPTRDLVFVVSDGIRGGLAINGSRTPSPVELRAGTPYRVRICDIGVWRQNLQVRVVRDSSLVTWRAVAKDGFALPVQQATMRPSAAQVASGETADFEFTPDRPGDLTLEIGIPSYTLTVTARPGSAPIGFQVQGVVRLRVTDR